MPPLSRSSGLGGAPLSLLAAASLLLAASVPCAAREGGLGSFSRGRRLQATSSPSICAYEPSGYLATNWYAYCGVNPEWLAKQKGVSKLANVDIKGAKASLACAQHDLSVNGSALIDAMRACVNDTANFCFVAGDGESYACVSHPDGTFDKLHVPCPGTLYEEFIACTPLSESECTGNCTWSLETLPANQYEQYMQLRNETDGLYMTRGLCYLASANLTSYQDLLNFQFNVLSPEDADEFVAVRGNCSYGQGARRRLAYDNFCYSFNDPALGINTGYVDANGTAVTTGINSTLATECLLAGCDLDFIPNDASTSFAEGDFYQCNTAPVHRYQLGYYSQKDVNLLRAVRACSEPGVRYNETRCLGQQL